MDLFRSLKALLNAYSRNPSTHVLAWKNLFPRGFLFLGRRLLNLSLKLGAEVLHRGFFLKLSNYLNLTFGFSMALIVQKYGGTSVGDVERIKNVAQRVKETYDAG